MNYLHKRKTIDGGKQNQLCDYSEGHEVDGRCGEDGALQFREYRVCGEIRSAPPYINDGLMVMIPIPVPVPSPNSNPLQTHTTKEVSCTKLT